MKFKYGQKVVNTTPGFFQDLKGVVSEQRLENGVQEFYVTLISVESPDMVSGQWIAETNLEACDT